MARITPQELADRLQEALGENLLSVTLYGPTALEEDTETPDDVEHPILIVTETLDLDALTALATPVREWHQSGHPHPLLFTRQRLKQNCDSFPVEFLDMKEARKVLYGEDSILKLELSRAYFQQELASNLKGELLALRSRLLDYFEEPARLRTTLLESLSSLRLFLRATLRLYLPVGPTTHSAVLNALKIHIPVDPTVYEKVEALKRAESEPESLHTLYLDYLNEIEKLIDYTDTLNTKRGNSTTYPPFSG